MTGCLGIWIQVQTKFVMQHMQQDLEVSYRARTYTTPKLLVSFHVACATCWYRYIDMRVGWSRHLCHGMQLHKSSYHVVVLSRDSRSLCIPVMNA